VAAAVKADPAAAIKALSDAAVKKLEAITNGEKSIREVEVDGKIVPVVSDQKEGFPINEDPNYFTHWECVHMPQWPGFYDVTDHKSGTLNARWWWGGLGHWFDGDPQVKKAKEIPHSVFQLHYAWRGLKQMPRDAYPVPPYDVNALPPGVAIDGKYIKRTRVQEE
jgi:hypothetical protein